jgi:hypothetical protein
MAEPLTKINIDKFLSADYLNMVAESVDYIIDSDDQTNAQELIRIFSEALNQQEIKTKINSDILTFYTDIIVKLQFIALPLLEDKEVVGLLAKNFTKQFKIADYNLLDKLHYKLLNIILIDDRNNLKQNLLKAILDNQEIIVPSGQIKKISEWLKNYVSSVSLDNSDKLVRAQYLVSLKSNKDISLKDYNNLAVLFKFYDELNLPADSPQGLNEAPPVNVDGKLYIFRKGVMEPVLENREIDKVSVSLSNDEEDGELANQKLVNQSLSDTLTSGTAQSSIDQPVPQAAPAPDPLTDLEQAIKNYSPDSLEYKAIKQEINRLKVSEFKQAQKSTPQSNVKK